MSFREKMHWVALVVMSLAFGWYFLTYPWGLTSDPVAIWSSAGRLLALTLGIIITMTAATPFLAIRNPKEVHLKEDERDKAIHMRGTHIAYYPMIVGSWTCIGLIFGGVSQTLLLNLLLAMVVLAELLRIGVQIHYYRRGY